MENTNNIKLSGARRLGWAVSTFASLLLLFAQRVASQTTYTITDIGTLGGTFGVAVGINDEGWIDGQASLPGDTAVRAFFWRSGQKTDLGTLGGLNSAAFFPLNDKGVVPGVSETSTPNPLGEGCFGSGFNTGLICRAFVWRAGVMTPPPTLGGYNSAAAEINNLGQVVGMAENNTVDPTCVAPQVLQVKPVIWQNGKVRELPTIAGDPSGFAAAINNKGQAVGHTGVCGAFDQGIDALHAVLWQGGTATDLGNLGGSMANYPSDINDQRQVVGGSNLPGDAAFHAFLWQNGVISDLGTLAGDVASGADSINNKGQVTGGSFDSTGNERAFLWQNGVMTDLNTLISVDSPLFLLEATNINDRGVIVGIAFQASSGELHAFIATPTSNNIATESPAAATQVQTPSVVLPKNARRLLQRYGRGRMKFLTSAQ